MPNSNVTYIAGIFLLLIGVLLVSGILTALLIPQMIALWAWFGYDVPEPDLWDVYLPFVTLMIMPVILSIFAVIMRKPSK